MRAIGTSVTLQRENDGVIGGFNVTSVNMPTCGESGGGGDLINNIIPWRRQRSHEGSISDWRSASSPEGESLTNKVVERMIIFSVHSLK